MINENIKQYRTQYQDLEYPTSADLQVDFVLLVSPFSVQPFTQFLPMSLPFIVPIPHQFVSEYLMENTAESYFPQLR